jgi:hypothetical protein
MAVISVQKTGVAATAASMKDVFLFPNSTITLSVAGNVLSKSMRYVEDRSTLQPFEATTSASLVKHHVISYIRSSYRRSSPWIISAGINTVLLEIFGNSTMLTLQILITGQWNQDGPTLWTQASPDIWVLENTLDIEAFMGMIPAMLDNLAANAFPPQTYGFKLHVFLTGTPDRMDNRVLTRHT